MLAALVIVFREALEAGLIVGVVLAASRGIAGREQAVALGVGIGVVGSAIVAVFAARITEAFEGRGQELFTAGVLFLAVTMLVWHVVWMAEHARELTSRLRNLGHAVASGTQSVALLGVVVALAVMREGSEVVLFLASIAIQATEDRTALALGSLGGLVLALAVSAAIYLGLAAIPLKRVFSVTGALVTLLAAGLAAQGIQQLANAGVLTILDYPLWDSSWLLSEESWPGRVLHVLIGYMDRPSAMQALAYVVTIGVIVFLASSRAATASTADVSRRTP